MHSGSPSCTTGSMRSLTPAWIGLCGLLALVGCSTAPAVKFTSDVPHEVTLERAIEHAGRVRLQLVEAARNAEGPHRASYLSAGNAIECSMALAAPLIGADDVRSHTTALADELAKFVLVLSGKDGETLALGREEIANIAQLYTASAKVLRQGQALSVLIDLAGLRLLSDVGRIETATVLGTSTELKTSTGLWLAEILNSDGSTDSFAEDLLSVWLTPDAPGVKRNAALAVGVRNVLSAVLRLRQTFNAKTAAIEEGARSACELAGVSRGNKLRLNPTGVLVVDTASTGRFNVVLTGGVGPFQAQWAGRDPGIPLHCEQCEGKFDRSANVSFQIGPNAPSGNFQLLVSDGSGTSAVAVVFLGPGKGTVASQTDATVKETALGVRQSGAAFALSVFYEGGEAVGRMVKQYGQRDYFKRDVEFLKTRKLITCPDGSADAGACAISDLGKSVLLTGEAGR